MNYQINKSANSVNNKSQIVDTLIFKDSNFFDFKNDDTNYLEVYNRKKVQFINIDKKLDYSIKERENFYKRKIKSVLEIVNINKIKLEKINEENDLLKEEINNLKKLSRLSRNQLMNESLEDMVSLRTKTIDDIKKKYLKDEDDLLIIKKNNNENVNCSIPN